MSSTLYVTAGLSAGLQCRLQDQLANSRSDCRESLLLEPAKLRTEIWRDIALSRLVRRELTRPLESTIVNSHLGIRMVVLIFLCDLSSRCRSLCCRRWAGYFVPKVRWECQLVLVRLLTPLLPYHPNPWLEDNFLMCWPCFLPSFRSGLILSLTVLLSPCLLHWPLYIC